MPTLPPSLAELLDCFRPCFTAPTFQTLCALTTGFLAQTRPRTITGMLAGARLAGRWHHSRAHRFFSHARWSADQVGLALLEVITARLLGPDAPLRLVVDDTLFHRSGRKVFGVAWHHDPAAKGGRRIAWGNNVGRARRAGPPAVPAAAGGVPAGARPAVAAQAPDRTKLRLACALVTLVAERYPDRSVHLVADAAYAGRALRELPASVTVRMRADAALHQLPPPRTGKPGRPRSKGDRLPELIVIAALTATRWQPALVRR